MGDFLGSYASLMRSVIDPDLAARSVIRKACLHVIRMMMSDEHVGRDRDAACGPLHQSIDKGCARNKLIRIDDELERSFKPIHLLL